jgi:primosomal protein N' (replication factor Y)
MKRESKERKGIHLISRLLESHIENTLSAGLQVMLLLNRRGYAGYIFCPSCDYVLQCPNCSTRMVYHKPSDLAICHHCSAKMHIAEKCDRCGKTMNRFGIGTQRAEEEIARKFPGAKISRMDQDSMNKPADYELAINEFSEGKTNVLLGTQMIAKGFDFPNVALVGVLSADMALSMPDFRAGERTFQLLAQVAGRAGRADHAGMVIVQSWNLDDPAIQSALNHDYEKFAEQELAMRKKLSLPPYSRLARLIIQHPQITHVKTVAKELYESLTTIAETTKGTSVIGPIPAMTPRLRNRYRYQILIKSKTTTLLKEFLSLVRSRTDFKLLRAETIIDIDPIDLM